MAKRNKTMIVTTITDPTKPYLQVIVGIKDLKANTFIEMGAVTNSGVAIRAFSEQINKNQDNNNLWKWPDDYNIYQLGIYDPQSGRVEGNDMPVLLAAGISVKVR